MQLCRCNTVVFFCSKYIGSHYIQAEIVVSVDMAEGPMIVLYDLQLEGAMYSLVRTQCVCVLPLIHYLD